MKSSGSELVKEVNGTDLLDTLHLFNADASYLQRSDEEKKIYNFFTRCRPKSLIDIEYNVNVGKICEPNIAKLLCGIFQFLN
jgi:hypothetical protein